MYFAQTHNSFILTGISQLVKIEFNIFYEDFYTHCTYQYHHDNDDNIDDKNTGIMHTCIAILKQYLSHTAKVLKYTCTYSADIDSTRLALAKSLGADYAFKVTTDDPSTLATDIVDVIGDCPDVTIECSGTNFGFSTGIHVRLSPMHKHRCLHQKHKLEIYKL
jgi:hypothetical protein